MKLLAAALERAGIAVAATREPGGSPGAERIRALLVEGEVARWDAVTETLLHFAARRDHLEKTIRPARLEFNAEQVPINCGGALVKPEDVVVADGDGVAVVPRQLAEQVAMYAREVADRDREKRRALYKQAGLPEDDTVLRLSEISRR